MNKLGLGSLVVCVISVAGACAPPRTGACVLESPPNGGPYLRRMASLTAARIPHAKAPVCTEDERGARLECEAIDDLAALTGGGPVCTPGGLAHQSVCPNYTEGRVHRLPEARQTERPCGETACPNVELVVDLDGETESRVTLYDDPSCHVGPTEAICADARHACYYRILSIQTVVKGTL